MWEIENIPNDNLLYYRVHHRDVDREGNLSPGAFRERDGGMSTDWNKYSTPEEAQQRARNPLDNGIVRFLVGDIRAIELMVKHDPLYKPDQHIFNRAHTNVIGIDGVRKVEMRLKLLDLYFWEIRIESSM